MQQQLCSKTATNTWSANAFVAWTPAENKGPGDYEFVARVTDIVDGTTWRSTNSFKVTVQAVNRRGGSLGAPRLSLDEKCR